jgi:hypothetical protein
LSIPATFDDPVSVVIGDMPVYVHAPNSSFRGLLQERYQGFLAQPTGPGFVLDIELLSEAHAVTDADVRVVRSQNEWTLTRGDFLARLNAAERRGSVRQAESPYAIDSVLRILHSIELARLGGCLLHAASAVRNGRAFVFAGRSGAGKTTISRLAPPDATLLTDEISYLRKTGDHYSAYGTPFAGELARSGANICAPLAALFLLEQGAENSVQELPQAEAIRQLMQNVLFFAEDPELVRMVFETVCDLAASVPVRKLVFRKDADVWELVQ